MSEVAANRPRTYRLVLQPCLQGRIYRNIQLLVIVHSAAFTDTRYFRCKMAFRFCLASQDVTLLDTAAYARHRRYNEPDHRPTAFPLHLPRYARGGEGAARSVSGLFQDSYGNDDVYLRFPLRLRAVHIRQKRAKHAVYENQRTLKAQKELSKGNLEEFGKLMNQSHESLRDDYEVTGVELDTLVELAWKQEGVIGSRMTGAGFGGCTVSIVKKDKVDDFVKNVGEKYRDKIGYDADFYIVEVSEGAGKL